MSDLALILRVQAGGNGGVSPPLVRKYQDRLLRHITRRGSDVETETKDLCQEVWLKAYRGIAGFRCSSSFYAWLYRMVSENVIIDHFRKQQPETEVLHLIDEVRITATAACPSVYIERGELREHLREVLRDLPRMRRCVFLLYYHYELN